MAKKGVKEKLPGWDLSHLYRGIDDHAITRDLSQIAKDTAAFSSAYEGKIKKLSAEDLAIAIRRYERLQELSGKIGSYAQLLYAGDMLRPANTQFYQNTLETLTAHSSRLVFFTLELNHLSDETLAALYKSSALLRHFKPWLGIVRSFKPYQLSDALERYIHEQSVTQQGWTRLFDESITRLVFRVKGKKLSSAEVFDLMSHKDGKTRKAAAKEIARVFAAEAPLYTLITNTLAKSKQVEDSTRGFKSPISSRNVANQVEDEVVEALVSTVRANYAGLSHRYYRWKAKQFGVKKLPYWDRNAPLPKEKDSVIPYKKAVKQVLASYHDFSPELAEIGARFFKENWVDVPVRAGKAPGAFAHPCVPSVHPYLLINYQGKIRDVMTLAHELGHGVHQVLAAKQGALMCDTPLTLAETASVFGEMLTFQSLLAQIRDKKQRRLLIASKVEDMLNTVVRQTAFCEFERRLHDARREGELSTSRIGELWMEVQRESLGPAIKLEPEYQHYWMYIPHFIHTPFYVYAYAFGDCLVNSLYGVFQREKKAGRGVAFAEKYLNMLEASGTLRHKELLAPFDLDATRPDFWQHGLDVIAGYIDELEA
ncbi:MAG: M3 family oligoendopeptidase [Alphaproteobacteria bacterium]